MKLFTVDEANELIPRLELTMGRLQQLAFQLRSAAEVVARELDKPLDDLEMSEAIAHRPDLRQMVDEMEALVREIHDCGGQFKGLELGLVDFPAEVDGEMGLLCWQYGEKEITHWHRSDTGFSGRQPLPGVRSRALN